MYNLDMLDKFDQFWSVNRRLMERINDESFRYVPFRLHQVLYICFIIFILLSTGLIKF